MTCAGVEPTTLCTSSLSTYFTINHSTIRNLLIFYDKANHAQFHFLAGLQILKKCSYDNQQEDIYIKLSFQSEKVYLLHSGHINRETHNSKMWGVRWETWTFGSPVFCSTTWANLTMLCERNCWIFKLVVIIMFKLVSL